MESTTTPPPPPPDGQNAKASAQDTPERQARAARDEATAAARSLGRDAAEAAQDAAAAGRQRARDFASRNKDRVAGELGALAQALDSASDQVRDQSELPVDQYLSRAAKGLQSAADALDARDLDTLMSNVQSFARRQPGLFVGGALVGGFVLARFLKASAERSHGGEHGMGRDSPVQPSLNPGTGTAAAPAGATGPTTASNAGSLQ